MLVRRRRRVRLIVSRKRGFRGELGLVRVHVHLRVSFVIAKGGRGSTGVFGCLMIRMQDILEGLREAEESVAFCSSKNNM